MVTAERESIIRFLLLAMPYFYFPASDASQGAMSMDTYIWYAVGAVVAGFLAWWLPRGDRPLPTVDRDDSPFDGDGD